MIYKIIAFLGTFFAYASLHSIRTGWSYSQPQLTDEQGVTTQYFGMVDTLYLICYAVGMGTLGNFLIGRLPLNYFIGLGMIFAALSYMSFSFYFLSTQVLSYPLITIFMCLNGLFQSTGIPGVTAVMGNWFSKGRRGLLMGFWAINGNIGNIIGSIICNVIQYNWQLPWTYNFIFTGCFTILVGLIVIWFLKGKPTDEHLHEREDEITDELIPDERGNGSQI
jgi:sugar phosphate permease